MPSIFEYLGIIFYFFSNEHEPIHVHARNGEFGKLPLKGVKLKDFKKFLSIYADKIVAKWVDYFIYHKKVSFEKIEARL